MTWSLAVEHSLEQEMCPMVQHVLVMGLAAFVVCRTLGTAVPCAWLGNSFQQKGTRDTVDDSL